MSGDRMQQHNSALPVVDLVRIGASAGRAVDATCPSSLAWKARPRSRSARRFPDEHWDGFVLRPVMDAVDRVEFDGVTAEQAIAEIRSQGGRRHPGVTGYAEHAARMYLESHQRGEAGMRPVRELWVSQRLTRSVVWELYAWGRRYESVDGRLREFRFLRQGDALADGRDEATAIAIAAYVAAFGNPAVWPNPWSEPFHPSGRTGTERVRVVSVGLADGVVKPLFEGTAADVEDYFAEHGRSQVGEIAAGRDVVPGFGCADCKRVAVCDGPVRTPGLLGLDDSQGPLRTVSVSGLRYYLRCPAQAYLRSVHLPRAYEYSGEAELGQAVHAWLEEAHEAGPDGCRSRPLPPLGSGWSAGTWQVTGDLADAGVRMLAQHAEVCPFREAPEIENVRVEPRLTVFDTTARAIVLAKPDLVYQEAGQWVWRELKSTQKATRFFTDPLRQFPQLALGVVILSAGALGPGGAGRVELEILRPTGAEIVLIDARDDERVDTARTVLRELAAPWRADRTFEARPSNNCQWCPVSRWCPSYPGPHVEGKDHDSRAKPATAFEQ
ncbi:PD-(D/E)XK nuclease family protein [Saccharopolyspora sp. ASAGF58]|nr:PD-(D/E)XK nuclease family protein [Saccharopolyspora sp. ASAGF58]